MKNFDWTTIKKRIIIDSSIDKIYDFWTKSNEIEKWFLAKAKFYTNNSELIDKQEPIKPGYKYDWNWFAQNFKESVTSIEEKIKDKIIFNFA